MNLTFQQKKVLRQSGMCKITYRNMFKKENQLGYCSKGGYFYDITIAKDVLPLDVQLIALIHECGHIALQHVHSDIVKELKTIEGLLKKYNKPTYMLQAYGGPHALINICMDFEVNHKYLTQENVDLMTKAKFPPCVIESYNFQDLGDFRNYYEPMIKRLPDNDPDFQQMMQDMKQALKDAMEGKGQGGQGTGNSGQNNSSTQPMTLPEWAQDLVDSAMEEAMKELGQDMKDALQNEDYQDSNDKAKYNNSSSSSSQEETTVDDAVDDAESRGQSSDSDSKDSQNSDTGKTSSQSYGIGSEHETNGPEFGDIIENNEENIRKFLNQFIKVGREYQPDSLRHHNHGSRRNSQGLLYTSMKRKIQEVKTKIAILVDVSGSMDSSTLLAGLGAIKAAQNVIDSDSILVTWDTHRCQEFKIREIPQRVQSGGGTDMARGVDYLIKKGFTKVVLYSDMETDLEDLIANMKAKKVEMYTIITDSYEESRLSDQMKEYLRLNKDYLRVK